VMLAPTTMTTAQALPMQARTTMGTSSRGDDDTHSTGPLRYKQPFIGRKAGVYGPTRRAKGQGGDGGDRSQQG
jgi:hypothetical protein